MKRYCQSNEWCNCTRQGVQFRECRNAYRGKSSWRVGLIIGFCAGALLYWVIKMGKWI